MKHDTRTFRYFGNDPDILDKPWHEVLSLPTRAVTCIRNCGHKTVRDLTNQPVYKIMYMQNCGVITFNAIMDELKAIGFKIR